MFENIVYCRATNVTRWTTGAGMCIACWENKYERYDPFAGTVHDEYNRITRIY